MNKFEEDWRHKLNAEDAFGGILDPDTKSKIWMRLGQVKFSYEENWANKYNQSQDLNGFLEEPVMERMEGEVVAGLHNFEANWRNNVDEFAIGEGILGDAGKNKIWASIQPVQQSDTVKETSKKARKLFAFHWSHAAAVIVGILGTWVFWNISKSESPAVAESQQVSQVVPTHENVASVVPNVEKSAPTIEANSVQEEKLIVAQVSSKGNKNTIAKQSERKVVENIEVMTVKVAPIQANPVTAAEADAIAIIETAKLNEQKALTQVEDEVLENTEKALVSKSTSKKVVFIADVKPKEDASKSATVYARAFGSNNKENQVAPLSVNPVFKKIR